MKNETKGFKNLIGTIVIAIALIMVGCSNKHITPISPIITDNTATPTEEVTVAIDTATATATSTETVIAVINTATSTKTSTSIIVVSSPTPTFTPTVYNSPTVTPTSTITYINMTTVFPDVNLRDYIVSLTGKSISQIEQIDLDGIITVLIDATINDTCSLEGLQYLHNLTHLTIKNHTSFCPLSYDILLNMSAKFYEASSVVEILNCTPDANGCNVIDWLKTNTTWPTHPFVNATGTCL